jgi:phosphatidate phosphatase LPIN
MELLELAGYKSSYIHMSDLVDHFFPPVRMGLGVDEAYTDLRYWKLPLAEISDESDDNEDDGEGDEDEGDEDEGEDEDEDEGDEGDEEGDEVSHLFISDGVNL